MPRQKRIEFPGALYHVIARGIERCDIFRDEKDREEFLRRLGQSLKETGVKCYSWALMPNHFHLLVQTGAKPLSDLMRKLLTGYAVYFNSRHKRSGHLYQNRYKSILCQEEAYLLELVRYIHLNPIRGKLVDDMDSLKRYRWSGHAALAGSAMNKWQSTGEILERFGKRRRDAIKGYLEFIKDGYSMGRRPDLIGGGLRRSAGGWQGVHALQRNQERWLYDERILGEGEFVEKVLTITEKENIQRLKLIREKWDSERLTAHVCRLLKVQKEELRKKGRGNKIAQAKGLIAYWGKRELGLKGTEVGALLGISKQAVSLLVPQGEQFAKENNIILTS